MTSYHGVIYTEKFWYGWGLSSQKRTCTAYERFWMSIQSPQNAFILNLGSRESLHVRMPRHIAKMDRPWQSFYRQHDKGCLCKLSVDLKADKYLCSAQKKYLPNGACGVVTVLELKGGREAAETLYEALKACSNRDTCCRCTNMLSYIQQASTHRQMNDEELEACGVKPDLIRYSCGLENAEDLIADLAQALDQI